jgi:HEAT repeat protein
MSAQAHHLDADATAQLLLELSRALRARQYYPPTHEGLLDTLRRVARVWRDALAENRFIQLKVEDETLALEDGRRFDPEAVRDLTTELKRHGAVHLRAVSGVDPREVVMFIDALAAPPEPDSSARLFERRMRESGCRRISVTPPPRAPVKELAADDNTQARLTYDAPTVQLLGGLTVELVRELAELDRAEDVSAYNLISNRIEITVDGLLRDDNTIDAYRAILTYSRHVSDPAGRSPQIHREAHDRLRRLMRNDALLGHTVDQACRSSGLASVQATQILLSIGSPVMPRLLELLADPNARVAEHTASIIMTLGEDALPALSSELESGEPPARRRAARLLGDLQHPGAVPLLTSALQDADPGLRSEAAKSLARIGNTHAVHALVEALSSDVELARTIVKQLDRTRHPIAMRALYEIASGKREMDDEVALEAIRALGRIGEESSVDVLAAVLDHRPVLNRARYRPRRIAAAQALARIGGTRAYRALELNVRRGDTAVRDACERAIRSLAG